MVKGDDELSDKELYIRIDEAFVQCARTETLSPSSLDIPITVVPMVVPVVHWCQSSILNIFVTRIRTLLTWRTIVFQCQEIQSQGWNLKSLCPHKLGQNNENSTCIQISLSSLKINGLYDISTDINFVNLNYPMQINRIIRSRKFTQVVMASLTPATQFDAFPVGTCKAAAPASANRTTNCSLRLSRYTSFMCNFDKYDSANFIRLTYSMQLWLDAYLVWQVHKNGSPIKVLMIPFIWTPKSVKNSWTGWS